MHVLALALTALVTAGGGTPALAPNSTLVPWFVPRQASLGLFINSGAVSPNVRLGWEISVLEQPRNDLVIVLDVGSSTSLALPLGLRALYQHVAVVGVGYRSNREVLHWGFQLTAGAVWYRAAFDPRTPYLFENRVLSYSEGRVQLGARLKEHFIVAGYVGYAAPWSIAPRFPANIYVGGPVAGLVVDWR